MTSRPARSFLPGVALQYDGAVDEGWGAWLRTLRRWEWQPIQWSGESAQVVEVLESLWKEAVGRKAKAKSFLPFRRLVAASWRPK